MDKLRDLRLPVWALLTLILVVVIMAGCGVGVCAGIFDRLSCMDISWSGFSQTALDVCLRLVLYGVCVLVIICLTGFLFYVHGCFTKNLGIQASGHVCGESGVDAGLRYALCVSACFFAVCACRIGIMAVSFVHWFDTAHEFEIALAILGFPFVFLFWAAVIIGAVFVCGFPVVWYLIVWHVARFVWNYLNVLSDIQVKRYG